MIEHALCPLDTRTSLKRGLIHETDFSFTDENRNRKKGKVQIGCVDGLSPSDELYLNFSLPLKSDSARAWRFAFDPISGNSSLFVSWRNVC